jgi:tetratricopeptide (TPR) repeat protein
MKKRFLYYILVLFLFLGCSTQKNTWLSRSYHNLTARYNVLFNGQQSFERGRESMRKSLEDDFTNVLPMFAYSESAGGQVASSDMNRAIRKGRKLVEKHSINVKPKRPSRESTPDYLAFYNQREFNRWVDEAWMLIGKSHVFQRDWYEGISAFDMILQIFPEKRVRFEALLWIARAYIEMEDIENARLTLERYSSEVEDEKPFYSEAMATFAWYWIVQKDYEKALVYCQKAAESTNDRWQRVRWNFVLGQVAERNEQLDIARKAYAKVEKLNPDYEFVVHARIRRVLLEGGPDNPEIARRELEKYSEEHKNLDFRDEIYFAIAQTWFWEGDTLNALTSLQLAAGYGGGNRILSGNIFKHIAEVYFRSGEYIAADAYFDSTLSSLPVDYDGLYEIKSRKKKLDPLAENLKTIQYEDSVQRIAALPEAEREAFINNLLARVQEEKNDKRFVNETDDSFFYRNFANRGNQSADVTGKWYFYNQTMVSLGQMEFEKRWGRRKLEDNWRRSNKRAILEQDSQVNDGMMPSDPFSQEPPRASKDQPGQGETQDALPDRETLIAGLPLSDEKLRTSSLNIQGSMFNAGHILAYNFHKYTEAIEIFEQLLARYPQTSYREQTLMGIYMACRKKTDSPCMDHYGKVIIDDYPQSKFAEFIRDPQYIEHREAIRMKMNKLYEEAYDDFFSGYWNEVTQKTERIIDQADESLIPQAILLNAVAYGQTDRTGLFRSRLQNIVDNFPQTSQALLAQNWLVLLDQGRTPQRIDLAEALALKTDAERNVKGNLSGEGMSAGKFTFEPDSVHQLIIVMDSKADINQLMFYLANFNFNRYTIGSLELRTENLGPNVKLLETGPFENRIIGLDYFFALLNNPSVFKINNAGEPIVMIISEKNRRALNNAADLEEYQTFFLNNYLPGSDPSAIVINKSEIPDRPYVDFLKENETQ